MFLSFLRCSSWMLCHFVVMSLLWRWLLSACWRVGCCWWLETRSRPPHSESLQCGPCVPPRPPVRTTRTLPTLEQTRLAGTSKEAGQGLRVEDSKQGRNVDEHAFWGKFCGNIVVQGLSVILNCGKVLAKVGHHQNKKSSKEN